MVGACGVLHRCWNGLAGLPCREARVHGAGRASSSPTALAPPAAPRFLCTAAVGGLGTTQCSLPWPRLSAHTGFLLACSWAALACQLAHPNPSIVHTGWPTANQQSCRCCLPPASLPTRLAAHCCVQDLQPGTAAGS